MSQPAVVSVLIPHIDIIGIEIQQETDSEDKTPESEHESEPEEETIPEIQPRGCGPKRKKKPEIIPEISPFKIKTPKQKTKYKEGQIQQGLWSDDEEDQHKKKI